MFLLISGGHIDGQFLSTNMAFPYKSQQSILIIVVFVDNLSYEHKESCISAYCINSRNF